MTTDDQQTIESELQKRGYRKFIGSLTKDKRESPRLQSWEYVNIVVIDPCAGSGTTLRAAAMLNRRSYGFEIKKDFCREAELKILSNIQQSLFV